MALMELCRRSGGAAPCYQHLRRVPTTWPDAHRIVAELRRAARASYVPPAAFVAAHTAQGDVDGAFTALEQAYAERSNLIRSLRVLPVLDPLRRDRRFRDLLRRVGLGDSLDQ
jgi:hypothetical protein